MTSSNDHITIVGIGSSAGGLEPLKIIVSNIAPSENFTYIIATHLDPNKPTKLLEILQRISPIPVLMINDKEKIAPNKVYICPPKYDLKIKNGKFELSLPNGEDFSTPSINKFFTSLAIEKKDKAIGIILSGAGNDGSIGISDIKSSCGITIVQKAETAKYSGMIDSAIKTEHIDLILSPEAISAELNSILKYPLISNNKEDCTKKFQEIFDILLDKTSADFSDYKMSTIERRIKRRMIVNRKKTIDEYIEFLKSSEKEIVLLHKELLIIVTSFFRDKEAFKKLESTIEKILIKNDKEKVIRVWVSGCGTGEEAYSMAILLIELLNKNKLDNKLQIFATDISYEAIKTARNGLYSEESLKNIKSNLLSKYFKKVDNSYKICKDIRDLIIFSKHDIVKDPPFLNMDLVTCRNLLIYFNSTLQKRIFSIFYNVLNKEGILFLGKSESTTNLTNLFLTVDSRWKIFKKDLSATPPTINTMTYNLKKSYTGTTLLEKNSFQKESKNTHLHSSLAKTILDKYFENYIIINRENSIIYTKGNLEEYIKFPVGGFTQDIFAFLKDSIRVDIKTSILKARREKNIIKSNIIYEKNKSLLIDIIPIEEEEISTEGICIVFKQQAILDNSNVNFIDNSHKLNIEELEQELIEIKETLQSTIEELETSNEELQSTNEELQSSNEELQSTNEELETSNEELQSTNEELETVNQELEVKTDELKLATLELENINNNLENIIENKTAEIKRINVDLEEKNKHLTSTSILFENTFEQAAVGIAHISLEGKHLKTNNKLCDILAYTKNEFLQLSFDEIIYPDDLNKDLEDIKKLINSEINYYSVQKRYYRKDKSLVWLNITVSLVREVLENKPDYFIYVVEDISLQKEYQQKLEIQKDELETIFNFSHDCIAVIDLDTKFLKFNKAFVQMTGYTEEFLLTKSCSDFISPNDFDDYSLFIKEVLTLGYSKSLDKVCIVNEGKKITVNMSASLLYEKKEILLTIKDISSLKVMEQQAKLASMGEMIGNIAHQWRQPLSIITTSISGLKLKSDFEQVEKEDIDKCENIIMQQSNYLSTTIDNFRNFLRADKTFTKLKINSVIEDTLSLVKASLENNYITLSLDIDGDFEINGNKNELVEALLNILNNSKDILKSKIEIESDRLILVRVKNINKNSFELKIIDSGGGISSVNLKKIFEPYFTTKHKSMGTGLGLFISYKILTNRHKAKISVTNEDFVYNDKKYSGACFKIVFKKALL